MANAAEVELLDPPKKQSDPPPAEEGAPSWMVTFADMMSLLLCFFVLLLSFSSQNVAKFEEVLGSLQYAFGVTHTPSEYKYGDLPGSMEQRAQDLTKKEQQVLGLVMVLKQMLEKRPELENMAVVSTDHQGATLRIQDGVLFETGSAELKPEAMGVLEDVAHILESRNFNLAVRGHTDDEPAGRIFASNWELSAARSAVAANYVVAKNPVLFKARVKAVGYADARPLVPNNDPESKQLNRRLEFYFHAPDAEEHW